MNKYNLQYYIPDPKCVSDILIRRRTLTNRLNRFSTTDVILFNTLTCFFPAFLNASACYLYYYQSGTTGVLRCTAVASSLQQLCKTTFIHLLLNREILKFITVVFIFDFFYYKKISLFPVFPQSIPRMTSRLLHQAQLQSIFSECLHQII